MKKSLSSFIEELEGFRYFMLTWGKFHVILRKLFSLCWSKYFQFFSCLSGKIEDFYRHLSPAMEGDEKISMACKVL